MHDGVLFPTFLLLLHLLVVVVEAGAGVQQRADGGRVARASLTRCRCLGVHPCQLVRRRVVLHVCVHLWLCTH